MLQALRSEAMTLTHDAKPWGPRVCYYWRLGGWPIPQKTLCVAYLRHALRGVGNREHQIADGAPARVFLHSASQTPSESTRSWRGRREGRPRWHGAAESGAITEGGASTAVTVQG